MKKTKSELIHEMAERTFHKYLDFMFIYLKKSATLRDADHQFLRRLEELVDIPEQGCDDFRRMVAAFTGQLAYEKKAISWSTTQPSLKHAILSYLAAEDLYATVEETPSKYRRLDEPWEPAW